MIITPQFTNEGILKEYPRPLFKRNSYLNLNGEWDLSIKNVLTGMIVKECTILVPYAVESKKSNVLHKLTKDEVLIYKKAIILDRDFNKGKLFLNIGASDQITTIYCNNKMVNRYYGGYTNISCELTDYIDDNVLNLVIEVMDDTNSNIYGRGKQSITPKGIWYTQSSGIWQTVFLESTPTDYIKTVKITPLYNQRKVQIDFDTSNDTIPFKVEAYDHNTCIASLLSTSSPAIIDVKDVEDWTIDNPHIYILKFYYGEDVVESYFGLRNVTKIKVLDKYYFGLNNEPIFHNGLLDQGYYPEGIYTPNSNKEMYDEIKNVKELGFNMLRKHIKVEPQLWYYYCDILGVMVWQDMVNGGAKYNPLRIMLCPFLNIKINDLSEKQTGRNEQSRKQYIKEATDTITQLYNHPSIMLWTPFNEGWGQFDSLNVCRVLKQLDETRLYDNTSGWFDTYEGDLNSKHIYFRKIKLKNDYKRILALTEFGGYSYKLEGHTFTNKTFGYKMHKTKDDLMYNYKKLFENEIYPALDEGLSATVYTQLTDVEDEINGLYTYDRILKVDEKTIKDINDQLYKKFDSKF